jgi:mannose-6-phosphate isomerase-like protein (cupin superfamily)
MKDPRGNQNDQTSAFGGVHAAVAELLRLHGISLPARAPRYVTRSGEVRLPVESHLARALDGATGAGVGVCAALGAVADGLVWRRNAAYAGAAFLEGYGYCELGGPVGHWETRDYAVGLLLLAPEVEYPAHAHPATETYVILSGASDWRFGGAGWTQRRAGDVVRHESSVAHAMRSRTTPLLALYHWADHLDVPARLVPAQA